MCVCNVVGRYIVARTPVRSLDRLEIGFSLRSHDCKPVYDFKVFLTHTYLASFYT